MATRAATAIRQETATSRIIGAAKRIGLDQAELRSDPRDRETQLADVLEQCATMMEAAADVIERLAAGETATGEASSEAASGQAQGEAGQPTKSKAKAK